MKWRVKWLATPHFAAAIEQLARDTALQPAALCCSPLPCCSGSLRRGAQRVTARTAAIMLLSPGSHCRSLRHPRRHFLLASQELVCHCPYLRFPRLPSAVACHPPLHRHQTSQAPQAPPQERQHSSPCHFPSLYPMLDPSPSPSRDPARSVAQATCRCSPAGYPRVGCQVQQGLEGMG